MFEGLRRKRPALMEFYVRSLLVFSNLPATLIVIGAELVMSDGMNVRIAVRPSWTDGAFGPAAMRLRARRLGIPIPAGNREAGRALTGSLSNRCRAAAGDGGDAISTTWPKYRPGGNARATAGFQKKPAAGGIAD